MVFTTKIWESFGLTRDSVSLLVVKWFGACTLLVSAGVDLHAYGVPTWGINLIRLTALFASLSAAQHRTSDLPGAVPKVSDQTRASAGAGILGAILLACALAGGALVSQACASAPPAGTYSAVGQQAWQADQLLNDLTAISQTAVNLNAAQGALHLKDRDTALIRDFALPAAAALNQYGQGVLTLAALRAIVVDGFGRLQRDLSVDAKQHPQLVTLFAALAAGVQAIPLQ